MRDSALLRDEWIAILKRRLRDDGHRKPEQTNPTWAAVPFPNVLLHTLILDSKKESPSARMSPAFFQTELQIESSGIGFLRTPTQVCPQQNSRKPCNVASS